jgi:hypothetical protein
LQCPNLFNIKYTHIFWRGYFREEKGEKLVAAERLLLSSD